MHTPAVSIQLPEQMLALYISAKHRYVQYQYFYSSKWPAIFCCYDTVVKVWLSLGIQESWLQLGKVMFWLKTTWFGCHSNVWKTETRLVSVPKVTKIT